jgi:DNA-binding transcriptional MerR regulator
MDERNIRNGAIINRRKLIHMEGTMDRVDNWGETLRNLNNSYDSLASFREVSSWVEKAESVMREADELHHKMSQGAIITREKLTHVENERKNKSFLKRTFVSHKGEQELEKEYSELISQTSYIDKIKTIVRQKIDGVPKSRNDQVDMLKKLNLQKKELNIHIREVNESMRQVNASARQARAKWAGVRGKGLIGTTARISRASITNAKEDSLRPLETKRAELEAELASLEHEELRISRISNIDEVSAIVNKCKYCGRELCFESVCPGCGAAN